MSYSRAAGVALIVSSLLLTLPVTLGFVAPSVRGVAARRNSGELFVTVEAKPLASSILPPLPESRYRRTRNRNHTIDVGDVRSSTVKTIPDAIPRLSDVIKRSTKASSPTKRNRSAPERQRQPTNEAHKPWKAGYYTSLKSQKKIQDAAKEPGRKDPIERASSVLETFLSLSPAKCNAANVVCALTLSAKVMGGPSNEKFRSLLYRTCDILGQVLEDTGTSLSARQLCNVAWALAKHSDRDDRLLPVAHAGTSLSVDDQIGTAETWDLRFDRVGCPARRLDETINTIAVQLTTILKYDVRAAKEGELCMASWAYGVLRRRRRPPGWKHGPQLGTLSSNSDNKQSSSHLIKFEQWGAENRESASNSSLDSSDEPSVTGTLLDSIGHALCTPVELMDHSRDADTTTKQATLLINKCTWSELANVAWAFASHGRSNSSEAQALLAAISLEASRRLIDNGAEAKQALSRDIAQIVWSLGTLQTDNFRLGDSFVQLIDAVSLFVHEQNSIDFKAWSCADIVQVVLSLAHARLDELPLLQALYSEAITRLDAPDARTSTGAERDKMKFQAWETSVLLWAQARFYLTDSQGLVFGVFAGKAVRLLNSMRQQHKSLTSIGIGFQEQANIAWSLTVLELYENTDAIDLLSAILSESAALFQDQGVIQLEHAHQLWQALFLLEDDYPNAVSNVPEWFRGCLQDKWNIEKSRPKISSARHMALSETLKLMNVPHVNEHVEDIDVAIILKPNASWTHETEKSCVKHGVKVAVEFDGPNHFTRQRLKTKDAKPDPPRALGHSVLKYRLLKKQGWTVVRIPYYEFDKIPFWASMERQRYVQRCLRTHGNIRHSTIDVSEYKIQVPNRGSRFD